MSINKIMQVVVLGAGSWGTALACLLSVNNDVILWAREKDIVDEINEFKTNKKYFINKIINNNIKSVNNISEIVSGKIIFFAVPSQFIFYIAQTVVALNIDSSIPLVVCSKGIVREQMKFPYQVLEDLFPKNPILVLSGPNFANEVIDLKLAASDLASTDLNVSKFVASTLVNKTFGVKLVDDLLAVQISGIMKNVIAIGCGMAIGWNMGENACALIFQKGFSELSVLCNAMNGDVNVLSGLSGIGDLFLTCSSLKSRNTRFGRDIVTGNIEFNDLSEGFASINSLMKLSLKFEIKLPLCSFIANAILDIKNVDKNEYSLLLLDSLRCV